MADFTRPRWDYWLEFMMHTMSDSSYGFVVCIILYMAHPSVTIANPGFYLFGKYHWSGYVFALSLGWIALIGWAVVNVHVFLTFAYLLGTKSTVDSLE